MEKQHCWPCNGTGWAHVPDAEDPFTEVKTDIRCPNCDGKGSYPIHADDGVVVNLIPREKWFTARQWRLRNAIMRGETPRLRQKWWPAA